MEPQGAAYSERPHPAGIMCLRVAALLLAATAASAQPSLDAFSLSAGDLDGSGLVFDLTDGPETLRLSVATSSPGTSVEGITVSMTVDTHFGSTATRVAPTIRQPSATVDYVLPRFLETGTYELNVGVHDAEGRIRRWTVDELANAGLPNRFEVRVTGDLAGPEISRVLIEPVADAFAPQGVAHVTLYDPSGILAYRVTAESPSGRRVTLGEMQAPVGQGPGHTFSVPFDLSSVTPLGEPAEEGRWTIVEIRASDSNGTTQAYSSHDLVSLRLQSGFWVGPVPPEAEATPGCGWPNPVRAGGAVRVPASAVVYDARGRRVGRADVYGVFDTTGLGAGLYVARVADEEDDSCRLTIVRP